MEEPSGALEGESPEYCVGRVFERQRTVGEIDLRSVGDPTEECCAAPESVDCLVGDRGTILGVGTKSESGTCAVMLGAACCTTGTTDGADTCCFSGIGAARKLGIAVTAWVLSSNLLKKRRLRSVNLPVPAVRMKY